MIYGNKLTQYKKTNVETATGLEIVVMCYEHAIRFIAEAKEHYESQEYMEKGRALQRALDIIGELKCSLDFERGVYSLLCIKQERLQKKGDVCMAFSSE